MIRKIGSKWVLFTHDGSKRLGEYDTESEAKEREKQVQMFKHMKKDKMSSHLVLGEKSAFSVSGERRFAKDILRVGNWVHPDTKQTVSFDEARLEKLAANTNRFIESGNVVRFPDGHSFKALDNLGEWPGPFIVHDKKLVAVVDVKSEKALSSIKDGTVDAVSAFIEYGIIDSEGKEYDEVITHVCATPCPVIPGQNDFLKLSVVEGDDGRLSDAIPLIPAVDAGGAGKGVGMDRKAMLASLAALSLSVEKLGLKEDATEEQIFDALGKRQPPADDSKKAVADALAKVDAELTPRGLKLDAGKVVEVAKPKTEDTPEVKELREKLAQHELRFAKERIALAKALATRAVEDGKIPPAVSEKVERLLSLSGKITSLALSKDGAAVESQEVEALGLLKEVLEALPKWGTGLASGSKAPGEKEKEEALSKAAKEIAQRVQPATKK